MAESIWTETEQVSTPARTPSPWIHVRAKTSHDGVEVDHDPAAVPTVEDGVVVAVTFYLDRDRRSGAAGLSR